MREEIRERETERDRETDRQRERERERERRERERPIQVVAPVLQRGQVQTCVIVITFEPAYVRRQVDNMSGGGLPLCVCARGALRGLDMQ